MTNYNEIDITHINEQLNEQLDNELIDILSKNKHNIKKTILILSGGGVKGIAHIGALKALEDLDMLKNIKTIAATSVGSLVGYMYIIGYSPIELLSVIKGINMGKMKSLSLTNLLDKFSIDDGTKMLSIIEMMTSAKKYDINVTFKELYSKTHIAFTVVSACLNNKEAYYFSHTRTPNMSIIKALMMSIAVPIYFPPVTYDGKMFVDGGCMDNYPIGLFADKLDSVIGIYLCDHVDFQDKINNLEDYLLHLMQCLFEGATCNAINGFEQYTIPIKISKVNMLNLDLSVEKRQEIFDIGYKTVYTKLKTT